MSIVEAKCVIDGVHRLMLLYFFSFPFCIGYCLYSRVGYIDMLSEASDCVYNKALSSLTCSDFFMNLFLDLNI